MKVFTIGSATQDIFIHYRDPESLVIKNRKETRSYLLLEKGAKIDVQTLSYSTGGGATNSAVSFKRLGFDVTVLAKLGDGKAGQYVIDQLSELHIDTQYVVRTHDVGTGLSYIIPSFEGDRTIFAYRGANALLSVQDVPLQVIEQCNGLYITSLSGQSSSILLPVVQRAKKQHIPVAINPGVSQLCAGCQTLAESLPFIDIFIVNSQEAKTFMLTLAPHVSPQQLEREIAAPVKFEQLPALVQSLVYIENINFNLKDFCKGVMARGPKIVVVTNGEEGVYVAHDDALLFFPSLPVETIDTVGAGDAFGSCFAASLWRGQSVEDALINGIVNASSVIAFEDAKTGLLTSDELTKRATKVDRALMQRYKL